MFCNLGLTVNRDNLCSCNPCGDGQRCVDAEEGSARQCIGGVGTYGSTYTLTFSDDAGSGSTYRVRTAGQLTDTYVIRNDG